MGKAVIETDYRFSIKYIKLVESEGNAEMKATTKKQHYIWRKYLSPWTENNSNTGKIACLRNQKVFSTSLMNVAHENYFYEITEMSPREKNLVYSLAIEHGANRQKEVNQGWLEFCALHMILLTGFKIVENR